MTHFDTLGLAEPVLHAVAAEGYETPTPIQAAAIPALLEGQDVVGIAQTGTGKTAAFVLPLLSQLAAADIGRPRPKTCRALILVPTRELATQVADSVKRYGRNLRLSSTVVIGGASPGPQVRNLARGVDIVIATPGRLIDHMTTGAVRLDQTATVVLDEADQMLDLGFVPAVRRILAKTHTKRQTVLFSATMPGPIRSLADEFMAGPIEVSVAPQARPIERIDQTVVHMSAADKRDHLIDYLGKPDIDRAIVFTRTKHGADRLAQQLERAGLATAAIHGNKSQGQRDRALGQFKRGRVAILVATDVAARGIDIDDVSHVVNYDLPNVAESYVHRIGRTARAGRSGTAIAYCDPAERNLLRAIEKLIGATIPGIDADGNPFVVPTREPRGAGPGAPGKRRRGPPRGTSGRHNQRSDGGRPGSEGGQPRPGGNQQHRRNRDGGQRRSAEA